MMKLKVLKKFHDKETDQLRNAGDEIEVSDERGKEILASKINVAELLEVGEPDAPQSGTDGDAEEIKPAEVTLEEKTEGTYAVGKPAKQVRKTKNKK